MVFPSEILETILKYLDGTSLRNASMVNHQWNEEVNRKSLVHNNWERICLEEIPLNVLEEISIQNKIDLPVAYGFAPDYGLPKAQPSPWIDWQLIYINWRRWSVMPDWACFPRTISKPALRTPNEHILRLKVSGDFVVTGHLGGCVMLWNSYPGPVGIGYPHQEEILDMMLLQLDKGPHPAAETATPSQSAPSQSAPSQSAPSQSPANKCHQSYLAHDMVVTVSDDRKVAVTWLNRYCWRKGRRILRPGPQLPEIHQDSTIAIRAITRSAFVVISADRMFSLWQVQGSVPIIVVALYFKSDAITSGKMKNANLLRGEIVSQRILSLSHASFNYHMLMVGPSGEVDPTFGKSFFRNSVTISIDMNPTTPTTLIITVLGNAGPPNVNTARYDVLRLMPSEPVSWLLYSQVLVLGLRSGAVVIYRVRKDQDLLHLDLSRPDWQYRFKSGSIIALGVHDGRHPRIAAASYSQVHYIWFYHPKSNNYRFAVNDPLHEDELFAMVQLDADKLKW